MTQESPFPECYVFWEVHCPKKRINVCDNLNVLKNLSSRAGGLKEKRAIWKRK